jgi:hypothetical protein
VGQHDRTSQARPGRGQGGTAAVDPTEHGQDSEIERQRPDGGRPLPRRAGVQQRGRELLAPDHDGVGGRPQQHQVQGQPAPAGDPVAEGERHPTGGQVGEDEPGHQEMAAGPPGLAGTPGRHRWAGLTGGRLVSPTR